MSKEFSININDFIGIDRTIAEKADVNDDKNLSGYEISLFNDIKSTCDYKNNTFIFGNKLYNAQGEEAEPRAFFIEQSLSTRVNKQEAPIDIEKQQKNNEAINKAKQYCKQLENINNKTVNIHKKVNGILVKFSYNKSSIEEYIINDSVDAMGNKITRFSDIPDIRRKPFFIRTKDECRKLVEFNNMINLTIQVGLEYGIDPKLIVAIMQRETGYNGLSEDVVGKNGKGYMQLTSAPINDILGGYSKNKKLYFEENLKIDKYGPEVEELLKSRGFDVDCPPEQRKNLVEDIMNYLKNNKDIDFNIRLGTLILRYYLNKSNGDIQLAAQNYNGNGKRGIKYAYGRAVKNYYNKLNQKENMT